MSLATPGIRFRTDGWEPPNPYLARSSAAGNHGPSQYAIPQPHPQRAEEQVLAPRSVSVVLRVVQDTAKATVTQCFENTTSSCIGDGIYQFPLPYGSTVVGFNFRIGTNRAIHGQVKPRQAARTEFNNAAKRARTAGLVEQNSPEIFSTAVKNIPPGTELKAELSYIFLLKYSFVSGVATMTLTVPAYIAPRYGNPGFDIQETGPQPNRELSMDIDILARDEIVDVRCDTHTIEVVRGEKQRESQSWLDFIKRDESISPRSAHIRLSSTGLTCDCMVRILTRPPADSEQLQGSLETHPSLEGHSALMIEIPSNFMLQDQAPLNHSELVFLADRSGSMQDKIPSLISSLEYFLKGIPQSKRFNIWSFGSETESLWPNSQPYDDDTLAHALSYVGRFSDDMGGTDLLPALQAISRARLGQDPLDVVILTDGEVWRLEETVEFVREVRRESEGFVRFFALGIGQAVSHELVESVAKVGGGYAEVIPAASMGGWEDRVVAVLSAALTGHIGHLRLEWEDVDLEEHRSSVASSATIQISPTDVSNLSPFVRNRVYILAENHELSSTPNIKIKINRLDGREVVAKVPISSLALKDSTIHKFAARALLGHLERGESWIQRNKRRPKYPAHEQGMTVQEGERLGCKWSLVSKWTSFVAVETIDAERDQNQAFHPAETTPDPPDAESVSIEKVDGDGLGLLRPRGPRIVSDWQVDGTQIRGDWDPDLEDDADSEDEGGGAGFRLAATSESPIHELLIMTACASSDRETGTSPTLDDAADNGSYVSPSRELGHCRGRVADESEIFMDLGFSEPRKHRMRARRRSSMMVVKAYNPPSTSALLDNQARIKPDDIRHAEAYIHRIVQFQQSDGRFQFPTENNAKKILGLAVFNVVEALMTEVSFELAVTITVVGILQARLQQCSLLWSRAVSKAEEYIESQGTYHGIGANDSRIQTAKRLAAEIDTLPFTERKTDEFIGADCIPLETVPFL